MKRGKASAKRTKTMSNNCGDRISALPDYLLLHILSFLNMEMVVLTSLLSTRWRYLWTSISCLEFGSVWKPVKARSVDRVLVYHEGSKLQKLSMFYEFKREDILHVDSWIRFAVRRDVEELVLLFASEKPTFYRLPQFLFRCTTLTTLILHTCHINLPATINLKSLKTLDLIALNLSLETIKILTSGCPVLELLYINGCNLLNDLKIVIDNPSIKFLKIIEGRHWGIDERTEIVISAPHIVSLQLPGQFMRAKYTLENLSNLLSCTFDGAYGHPFNMSDYNCSRLLGELHQVKELNLSLFFIQTLSKARLRNFESPPMKATRVVLNTNLMKWDFPGIFYVLKSFSELQTLTLKSANVFVSYCYFDDDLKAKLDSKVKQLWESEDYDFCNLKTVKIFLPSFKEAYWGDDFNVPNLENYIRVIQVVLKSSKSLEKLIIKCSHIGSFMSNKHESPFEFITKLINLPRASKNVNIHVI